jgi:geranylgeranylglycerol-phosphate geranylgeranyltransferase
MRARWPLRSSALLQLVRWANALTAAAGVAVGAWWAGWGPLEPIALAALAAIGLTAAANSWNDLADVAIDFVAHPNRPLPAGRLTVAEADRVGMASATIAVIAASMVSVTLGVCSVIVLVLMKLYSPWLKRAGFAGNLLVSVLASLPFAYGGYAVGEWRLAIPLVLIAAPLHLARELAKDLDDREADRRTRRTMPVVLGVPTTRAVMIVALAAFGAALAIGLAPEAHSPRIFVLALIPALAVLALATARALRGSPGSPAYFKLAMVCAMAALLVSRV